jgi:hypothetical protein
MRKLGLLVFTSIVLVAAIAFASDAPKNWSMKATIIEACSCPMFCQCYFSDQPAGPSGHGEHAGHDMGGMDHYCRFNNAFRVDKGKVGNVKIDGALFWIAGDLGNEFNDGEMEWAVLTFDPSVTKEQRDAITTVLPHVYPVKWKSFTIAPDAKMEWTYNQDRAEARLDGGKTAEVVLNRGAYGNTSKPVVIDNLKYWGVPRNDGFVLMTNEVEAYRAGDKAFEFKGTNGFMITFDINSKDVAAAK